MQSTKMQEFNPLHQEESIVACHITMKRQLKKKIKRNRERDEISYLYLEIKTDLFNPLIPAPGKLLLTHTAITRYVENHKHVIDEGRIKPETYHHFVSTESTTHKLLL